jgi:NAD/NADP transhydrogenase alpha subunit
MLIAASTNSWVGYVIAFVAAVFASANVVGGYVVTGRMLKMFRKRPAAAAVAGPVARTVASQDGQTRARSSS